MGDWNIGGSDNWGSGGATTSFNTNDEWNSGSAAASGWNDAGAANSFNDGGAGPSGDLGGSGSGAADGGRSTGCFRCGLEGHVKSECTNPRVERPKPKFCKQCLMENDHNTIDCKNPKKIDNSAVPDMSEQDAWELIKEASDDLDVGDFKEAVKILSKAVPGMTYPQLEKELRKRDLSIYLIGLKKEASPAYSNTNLQGEVGKPYQLGIFTKSSKCPRPILTPIWPKDDADNLQRLQDTGIPLERGLIICSNCAEPGHSRKGCQQDSTAPEPMKITCVLCEEVGHRARDCIQERPQPRAARTCKTCESTLHLARDCPDKQIICNNCGNTGHISRECKEAKDWSKHKCRHCGEFGHGSENRCDPEKKEAYAAAQAAGGDDDTVNPDNFDNAGAAGGGDGW